jgi:hypothetical protein
MFTIEEITLLESYKKDNRIGSINEIRSNYKYQEDKDIITLIDGLILKLEQISDIDFNNIDFSFSLLDESDFEQF